MFEWTMTKPIKIRNLRGRDYPVPLMAFFIDIAKEAKFELIEKRVYDCPYKSAVENCEIVMRKGGNEIRFGSSIHSFQFFLNIKGVSYNSMVHITPQYYARMEFVAIMVELYPWLSNSNLVRKFVGRIINKEGYNEMRKPFQRQRRRMQAIQLISFTHLLNQLRRE